MGNRQACLGLLLFAAVALAGFPGTARADEARSVGYVLSFRLGVEDEQAQELLERLSKATSDWHGRPSHHGEPVARTCASSPDCIRQAAKALGVSRIGVVAIVATAGVVRLDVRLADAETGSELQRTHVEFESGAGAAAAERAIFDLIPRLLPGEKAAPPAPAPTEKPDSNQPAPRVPPVRHIPSERTSNHLDLSPAEARDDSGIRWWLWGGLGAAATVTIVALLITTRDDNDGAPILELPPPR